MAAQPSVGEQKVEAEDAVRIGARIIPATMSAESTHGLRVQRRSQRVEVRASTLVRAGLVLGAIGIATRFGA